MSCLKLFLVVLTFASAFHESSSFQDLFKSKCRQNGGADADRKSQLAVLNFSKCLGSLTSSEELNNLIQGREIPPERVFVPYCKKIRDVMSCAKKMFDDTEFCFTEDERKLVPPYLELVRSLLEATCVDDGRLIKAFFTKGGARCVQTNQQTLLNKCVDDKLGKYLQFTRSDVQTQIGEIQPCEELDESAKCAVKVLEKCQDSTPAELAEIWRKVLIKQMCDEHKMSLLVSIDIARLAGKVDYFLL